MPNKWKLADINQSITNYISLVIFGYKNIFTVDDLKIIISPDHTNIEEGKQKEISIKDKKIIDDDINKNYIKNNIDNKNIDNTNIDNTNIDNTNNKIIGGGNIKRLTYIKYLNIYLCEKHNFFYQND